MSALERLCAAVGKVQIYTSDGEYRCCAMLDETPPWGIVGRGETPAEAIAHCWEGVRERQAELAACGGRAPAPWVAEQRR